MNLLAHLHRYPPAHGAGAEWMLHSILRWMVTRGHEARVIYAGAEPLTLDGVEVSAADRSNPSHYQWADVVLTHLDVTQRAVREARLAGRPLVHVVHNDQQLRYHRVRPPDAALVVFNSEWMARAHRRWKGPTIVCRPPVFAADYRVESPGDATTLINLSVAKGGPLFWDLARELPDRPFLGVRGAYAEQVVPEDLPANAEVWPNVPQAREIYRRTRVLLMPSGYESWGRCAVEAAASGIPTVGSPAPGLVEALGPSLIVCDPLRGRDWLWALRLLDDPRRYEMASEAVLERSHSLDPQADLEALEEALARAANRPPSPSRAGRPKYAAR